MIKKNLFIFSLILLILLVILILLNFISSYQYFYNKEIYKFYKKLIYIKLILSCIIILYLLILISYYIYTKQIIQDNYILLFIITFIFGFINIISNLLIIDKVKKINLTNKMNYDRFNMLEAIKFGINLGVLFIVIFG